MVLVLLSRFSHMSINSALVTNLPEWGVVTLMLFSPISPEDLWDANIIIEIRQAVCSSLGRLVSHG